jgi:NAD(P)-dependent dehydrogenase (short-subunit alcohol dehydrogenase family)
MEKSLSSPEPLAAPDAASPSPSAKPAPPSTAPAAAPANAAALPTAPKPSKKPPNSSPPPAAEAFPSASIKRRHHRLDILVNDVWGGDALTEFGKPFWNANLDNGLRMLRQAIHSHIITSHFAVPLMFDRAKTKGRSRGKLRPIIFEITDGDAFYYRGNLFYDLVKISVIRLAFAMARELRKRNIVSVALTPGFLRSEAVLDHFGVTEANWKDVGKRKDANANSSDQNDAPQDFLASESPRYIGRAVVALSADPRAMKKTGRVFSSWALAREYGFTDLDGSQPHWGNYARRKYGGYKICDDKFYSYWVPGLVELIFPDWF